MAKILSLVLILITYTTIKVDGEGCEDIILEDCHRGHCDTIEKRDVETAKDCQNYCYNSAAIDCESFAHNSKYKVKKIEIVSKFSFQLWDLYECRLSEWAPTCNFIGAPKGLSFLDCLAQDNGCDGFRKGDCRISGDAEIRAAEDLTQCEVIFLGIQPFHDQFLVVKRIEIFYKEFFKILFSALQYQTKAEK